MEASPGAEEKSGFVVAWDGSDEAVSGGGAGGSDLQILRNAFPAWGAWVGAGFEKVIHPAEGGEGTELQGCLSGSLIALNKKTGEEVWRVPGVVESWSTPLVVKLPDGEEKLVLSMKGNVLGIDPATGKKLWECEGIGDYVVPMVVTDDKGVVYISGGRASRTRAIRAGGRGEVSETHLLWELNKGCKVPSPLYHDGLLYWVSNLEKAACLDAKTGKLQYYERLERCAFYGSAVMAEGRRPDLRRQQGAGHCGLGCRQGVQAVGPKLPGRQEPLQWNPRHQQQPNPVAVRSLSLLHRKETGRQQQLGIENLSAKHPEIVLGLEKGRVGE